MALYYNHASSTPTHTSKLKQQNIHRLLTVICKQEQSKQKLTTTDQTSWPNKLNSLLVTTGTNPLWFFYSENPNSDWYCCRWRSIYLPSCTGSCHGIRHKPIWLHRHLHGHQLLSPLQRVCPHWHHMCHCLRTTNTRTSLSLIERSLANFQAS